jgi:acetyl-CoA carboxylase biotin carboxyl carrier protein
MDLNYLKKLMKIFDDSTADELLIEEEGVTLQIAKGSKEDNDTQQQMPMYAMPPAMQGYPPPPPGPAPAHETTPAAEPATKQEETDSSLHEIKSPIVGTFYRAPSPDSEPFVEVGTHVSQGSTLCIVEAMKLMNEIESDATGSIVKILVENGQPVEYNQPMFLIKPD